jgi:hypothetical protein
MALSFLAMHTNKQLKKAEAIVLRLEEKERKREKISRDPPAVD